MRAFQEDFLKFSRIFFFLKLLHREFIESVLSGKFLRWVSLSLVIALERRELFKKFPLKTVGFFKGFFSSSTKDSRSCDGIKEGREGNGCGGFNWG